MIFEKSVTRLFRRNLFAPTVWQAVAYALGMWCWMNTFRNLKALTTQTGRVQWERKSECRPLRTPGLRVEARPYWGQRQTHCAGAVGAARGAHAGEGKLGPNRLLKGWKVEQMGEQSQSSCGHGVREGPSRQGDGLLRVLKIRKCESVCEWQGTAR